MFKSYILIAWRNLTRQKALSFINLSGLSLGIACFSLFLLYALNEFSFDGFHRHAKDLYRAYDDHTTYKKQVAGGMPFTPMSLGPAMKQDLPGVVNYTRFIQPFETFLRQGDAAKREFIAFADPSFFQMFSFRLKEGDPAAALTGLHSLVVTEETAKRLFGNEKAMGKTIQIQVLGNAFEPFTVTGVAEDIPANSSIKFNMLANFQLFQTTTEGKGDIGNWDRNSFLTFIQLRPGSQLAYDQKMLTAFKSKYSPYKGNAKPDLFALEPLTQMHTDTGFGFIFMRVPPVDPSVIWILLSIAAGILLISCINFTTLSVGRSARRAREVGVRKAIGGSEASLRRQFLTESFLMTVNYMQSKDPGFAKDNVVVLEARNISDTKKIYARLRQGLAAYPEIAGTASADNGLGEHEGLARMGYDYEGKSFTVYPFFIGPDYVPVLGLKIVAGRNLSRGIAADTLRSVLINEAMVRTLGWTPASAIGRQLKNMRIGDIAASPTVVGVVKDINFLAMDQAVQPQLFHAFTGGIPYCFFVRIRSGDPSKGLAAIETEWKKAAPGYSLRYNFLDEDLDRYYTAEKRLSHIIGWAGGISVFLACLGLLGLAMLTALNRTKEIGIRKILGASVAVIVGLISRDFLRLVSLAFLIATPLAWYCMHRWLEGYYYRIQLSWWVFALTGVGILGMAWITVAVQAFKAGRANPVKSLRVE